jgi:hypothetical protein
VKVISFEQFASSRGASRQDIGEAALHMSSHHKSQNTHHKQVMDQARKDGQLIEKRDQLRLEFEKLVESGEVREPTRTEILIQRANGNQEILANQAARRLLIKRGISWEL